MSSSPAWDFATLEHTLKNTRFAGRVQYLPTATSTNTLAIAAAHTGTPAGAVWVAGEQTAGRGRGGHHWHSEPGAGLYVSILLRPRMDVAHALWLSLATGLAVQSAVAVLTGIQPDIRWPNDLLLPSPTPLGPAARKFGGILVETSTTPASGTLRYAVLGIGINVVHADLPPELSPIATSIYLATGQQISRETLLAEVLRALDRELTLLEAELTHPPDPAQTLLARFSRASTWVSGKLVAVGDPVTCTGTTAGLDSRGFLRVRNRQGIFHTVFSGGVRDLPVSPGEVVPIPLA